MIVPAIPSVHQTVLTTYYCIRYEGDIILSKDIVGYEWILFLRNFIAYAIIYAMR